MIILPHLSYCEALNILLLCYIRSKKGTTIEVDFLQSNISGHVDLYLDGDFWQTLDLYADNTDTCQTQSATGVDLSQEPHTILVINDDADSVTWLAGFV